ncbi:MAG: TIM barrel protein [Paracoccaceae bacterium]
MEFALNHMACPSMGVCDVLDIAAHLGCVGVELRNDLRAPLFDELGAQATGNKARQRGLRLLALAEIPSFNTPSDATIAEAEALIDHAKVSGAEAISLIPRNDDLGIENGERQANLQSSLEALKPLLKDAGIMGFIEPLGFVSSSLRSKREAIEAIVTVDGEQNFRIIHDTFHHHLAGEMDVFPEMTGIVHISGVDDNRVAPGDLRDAHRGLVGPQDRLGNIAQIKSLLAGGYAGPFSFEPFANEIHTMESPQNAIAESMEFIRSYLSAKAA